VPLAAKQWIEVSPLGGWFMGVAELKAALFKRQTFVCGGHGARVTNHSHHFTVPQGIKIHFYVHDGQGLPDDVGQKVDQILNGGAAPPVKTTYGPGSRCWDYSLYPRQMSHYLNLAMSTDASKYYITTTDRGGLKLSEICKTIIATCPFADLHWSACRSPIGKHDVFGTGKADYSASPTLAALASKAGKKVI
jgi:hypothetical protein